MMYRVQRGLLEVKARSVIQETTTRFTKVEGTIDFDADDTAVARAELVVDMRAFDAGDRFKNWKLKSELDPDTHPTATFTLARFLDIHEDVAGRYRATAVGQVRWRGRAVAVTAKGQATVDRRTIEASAAFDLDVRDLGMTPPRFLMLATDEVAACHVSLLAVATPS